MPGPGLLRDRARGSWGSIPERDRARGRGVPRRRLRGKNGRTGARWAGGRPAHRAPAGGMDRHSSPGGPWGCAPAPFAGGAATNAPLRRPSNSHAVPSFPSHGSPLHIPTTNPPPSPPTHHVLPPDLHPAGLLLLWRRGRGRPGRGPGPALPERGCGQGGGRQGQGGRQGRRRVHVRAVRGLPRLHHAGQRHRPGGRHRGGRGLHGADQVRGEGMEAGREEREGGRGGGGGRWGGWIEARRVHSHSHPHLTLPLSRLFPIPARAFVSSFITPLISAIWGGASFESLYFTVHGSQVREEGGEKGEREREKRRVLSRQNHSTPLTNPLSPLSLPLLPPPRLSSRTASSSTPCSPSSSSASSSTSASSTP